MKRNCLLMFFVLAVSARAEQPSIAETFSFIGKMLKQQGTLKKGLHSVSRREVYHIGIGELSYEVIQWTQHTDNQCYFTLTHNFRVAKDSFQWPPAYEDIHDLRQEIVVTSIRDIEQISLKNYQAPPYWYFAEKSWEGDVVATSNIVVIEFSGHSIVRLNNIGPSNTNTATKFELIVDSMDRAERLVKAFKHLQELCPPLSKDPF